MEEDDDLSSATDEDDDVVVAESDDLFSDEPQPAKDAVTIVNAARKAIVFLKFFIIISSCF